MDLCAGQLRLYSSITETSVDWLWYPYIPFGKLTLIQGDPGCGKSTLMMNIISAVSTCTIWPTRISFSKQALITLNNCEFVRIEINPNNKCLLVIPVTSKDKDSIRWIKGQKSFTVRNMESKNFGDLLYSTWGLNPECNYRTTGKLVSSKGKVMLLFNFSDAEMWKTKKAGI